MPELWRTVAENDRYEVSSLGRVRHKLKGNILKPQIRCGYPCIQLGSPRRKRNIHQLVCAAWHGPRPEGMMALHRNDIKTDNRPENLYWGDIVDNARDAVDNGRIHRGSLIGQSKLTADDVREIRRLRHVVGKTYRSIAQRYSVTPRTIRLIANRETWDHIE